MKKSLIIALIVFFILALIYFSSGQKKVCFDDKCVNVEIADSIQEQERGLMFRESLGENSGMLFVFDDDNIRSFWMKNTLISLDIIWIDENLKIVHIENAVPCKQEYCASYVSNVSAKYVLEVNGGFVEKNKIEVGDFVKID